MSRLLIKQRVFSWTDTYDVCDRSGLPKYYVKSEAFSIGHRIHIYLTENGREVGMIRERAFAFLEKADITVYGCELGCITKKITFFIPKYTIDYKGWQITGDIMGWDYSITDRNGENAASISRELLRWGDTYVLDVRRDDDELEALLTVIAIDMMNCRN